MTKTVCQRPRFMGKAAEQGIALLTVIFALLLITVLGLALTAIGIRAVAITTNERQSTEVLYIADSGIAHAKGVILPLSQAGVDFDTFLTAGDGNSCTGDELSNLNALGVAPLPAPLVAGDAIPTAGVNFPPGGSYMISVCDDDESTDNPPDLDLNDDTNGRIRVISTGLGRNNSTATIEIIIAAVSLPALVVDGDLRISGNPEITGDAGGAHTNGTLEISGNPCAEQFFSSAGGINASGNPGTGSPCTSGPGSDLRPGEAPIEVPTLNPGDFRPQPGDSAPGQRCGPPNLACYILGNDGWARDPENNILNPGTQDEWKETVGGEEFSWKFDPGDQVWKLSSNFVLEGSYYVEGNLGISGNPGSGPPGTPPTQISLIAEGSVFISGNPSLEPAGNTIAGGAPVTILANNDLVLSGNPGTSLSGLYYAGDQIKFSGNPMIIGQVLVKNLDDDPFPAGYNIVELDPDGMMKISGNPTITYDGGGGLVSTADAGWRECRGPNPADPCN